MRFKCAHCKRIAKATMPPARDRRRLQGDGPDDTLLAEAWAMADAEQCDCPMCTGWDPDDFPALPSPPLAVPLIEVMRMR